MLLCCCRFPWERCSWCPSQRLSDCLLHHSTTQSNPVWRWRLMEVLERSGMNYQRCDRFYCSPLETMASPDTLWCPSKRSYPCCTWQIDFRQYAPDLPAFIASSVHRSAWSTVWSTQPRSRSSHCCYWVVWQSLARYMRARRMSPSSQLWKYSHNNIRM